MFKVILIILLCVCVFEAGVMQGEKDTLERVMDYIKKAKNWDEFMEKISVEFNQYNFKEQKMIYKYPQLSGICKEALENNLCYGCSKLELERI